jgi:hypothetical protein
MPDDRLDARRATHADVMSEFVVPFAIEPTAEDSAG